MSNLLKLTKIEFGKFISSFSIGNKKKNSPFFVIALIIGVLMMGASAFYSWILLLAFKQSGSDPYPALTFFAGVASFAIFLSSINQARGIYIGDDYDMLASLPIRKRDIVASKILMLYLGEILFSVIILVPHGIMQLAFMGNATYFWISLLLTVFVPIVPVAIAVLVSLALALATSKFRFANLIILAFYVVLIAGISVLGVLARSSSSTQIMESFGAIGNILKWINPSYMLIEQFFLGNSLCLLWFILINIVVIIGTVSFMALLFDKLHALVCSVKLKSKYVPTQLKNRKESRLLLSLEFKRLINSRIYFLNSCMGVIMGIVATTITLFSMQNALKGNASSPEAVEMMNKLLLPIAVVVMITVFGVSNPACSAISIEGKTFWIIKSLPIDYRKYMWAKLIFPIIIFVPACLIASTIAIVFKHDDVGVVILTYLIPVFYAIFMIFFSLIINLRRYKLKWTSETEAVKNSSAVVITMLGNFGFTLVLGGATIALSVFFNPLYPLLGLLGIVVIAIIPCYLYLRKNFARKVEQIEDF